MKWVKISAVFGTLIGGMLSVRHVVAADDDTPSTDDVRRVVAVIDGRPGKPLAGREHHACRTCRTMRGSFAGPLWTSTGRFRPSWKFVSSSRTSHPTNANG